MSNRANDSVLGFGFRPAVSKHHFAIVIPGGKRQDVSIWEHFVFDDDASAEPSSGLGTKESRPRVFLKRPKWNAIADPLRVEFNRLLHTEELPTGRWKRGTNRVGRLLGKELTVLAWAIEDADIDTIPVAIRNWQGLSREERWWLFTMTCAATGHAVDNRGQGWRRALHFALTENPVVARGGDRVQFRLTTPEDAGQQTRSQVSAVRSPSPGRRARQTSLTRSLFSP